MIAWSTPEQLVVEIADATRREDIGAILVSESAALARADAVIAWLPKHAAGIPDEGDLFIGGPCAWMFAVRDALEAATEGRLDLWLAAKGFARTIRTARLPQVGVLAVAWLRGTQGPEEIEGRLDTLACLAAMRLEAHDASERDASTAAALLEAQRHRATGELASGLVHDFNNCLTTILGFTEMSIAAVPETDPLHMPLTTIRTAALDAAVLVRRLHAIRLKRRVTDERALVDVCTIAASMREITRPRWTRKAEIDGVSFEIVTDFRPVPLVHVVVAEIRELLLNLLFNAFDAMPHGGRITISTRAVDRGVAIAVRDEGTGMSSEVRARLFEPFFTTKSESGSGLGLSVCRDIARRHGGTIDVDSIEGSGTTFTITLPVAPPELLGQGTNANAAGTVQPPVSPPKDQLRMPPRRVLLVDDQEDVRDSVTEMLRALGHDVVAVGSGREALDTVRNRSFDVVITDFGMPGMNGAEVASRLHDDAPDLPVGLITGWGIDSETSLPPHVAFALGKPLTMKALGDAIGACGPGAADPDSGRLSCS